MSRRTILTIAVAALSLIADNASPQHIVPSALLTIDQNRSTVVERIVSQWGDRLASTNAGLSPTQLREILNGLRADHLLAASLAGSVEGLRDVVSGALVRTDTVVAPVLMHTKALGDTGDDFVYTPIVPCRILDTRRGTTPPYNAQMVGGSAFAVAGNLASFAPQGGSATSCNLPASFAAIAVTLTVLNPNFDAFLAASSASDFATLTQSVVMDFSANKGLANTAIVPVDGTVKFYLGLPTQVTTHVIADAVGYLRRPTNYAGTHTIGGVWATDGGGLANTASGQASTVAGGEDNTASGNGSTVAGGILNTASGTASTIAGGDNNTASGAYSTVAGGGGNLAGGSSSFAAGWRAKVYVDGSFVFSDSTNADFSSGTANEFIVGATGGIGMYTAKNYTTGCHIVPAGGTWSCSSSRDVKRDFVGVKAREVLRKVVSLPMSSWRFMNEPAATRHMGPMAQDFRAAFGVGEDDRHISTVDAEGVALAAIQGLHQLLKQKDVKLLAQERKISAMEREVAAIKERLNMR
jgi:hypothetical protein